MHNNQPGTGRKNEFIVALDLGNDPETLPAEYLEFLEGEGGEDEDPTQIVSRSDIFNTQQKTVGDVQGVCASEEEDDDDPTYVRNMRFVRRYMNEAIEKELRTETTEGSREQQMPDWEYDVVLGPIDPKEDNKRRGWNVSPHQ